MAYEGSLREKMESIMKREKDKTKGEANNKLTWILYLLTVIHPRIENSL